MYLVDIFTIKIKKYVLYSSFFTIDLNLILKKEKGMMRGVVVLGCIFLVLCLAGCGGSDSGGTKQSAVITGTAATGKAIIGIVRIKDSKGEIRQADLDSEGKYEIDLTGMSGPFILKAEGKVGSSEVTVHSVATIDDLGGNINITPLTDLIVANLAQDLAGELFDSFDSGDVTTDNINKSQEEVRDILVNIMGDIGLDASVDLMRNTFSADGTGLDALLDLIDIDLTQDDSGEIAVEIINTATNERIEAKLDEVASVEPLPTTPNMSELQKALTALRNLGMKWNALFKDNLPQHDNEDLKGLFHEDYLDSGRTSQQFINEVTGEAWLVDCIMSDFVITDSTYINQGDITFTFIITDSAGREMLGVNWTARKAGDKWLFAGDRYYFDFDVEARMEMITRADGTDTIHSGLWPWFGDEYNHKDTFEIEYVTVEGPGFPEPVRLNFNGDDEFSIGMYEEDDGLLIDDIQTPGKNNYTFKCYKANGDEVTFENRHGGSIVFNAVSINANPVPLATLDANPEDYFPQFTAPTGLCDFDGGDITASWIRPVNYPESIIDEIEILLWKNGGNEEVEKDLEPGTTSATLSFPDGDYTSGMLEVEYDLDDLEVERTIYFDTNCR